MARRYKISQKRRREVYVRDDWTCRYCGLQFDPNATWPENDSCTPFMEVGPFDWIALELDHIRPRHHGGSDDIENLCSACTTCNRKKSFNLPKVDA